MILEKIKIPRGGGVRMSIPTGIDGTSGPHHYMLLVHSHSKTQQNEAGCFITLLGTRSVGSAIRRSLKNCGTPQI